MPLRLAVAILCVPCVFAADNVATVAELLSTVRSSLANHTNDGDIARLLRKLKPAERIDYPILDALETEGVGPKTFAELERIRAASLDLHAPATNPVFEQEPMPSVEDQRRIV